MSRQFSRPRRLRFWFPIPMRGNESFSAFPINICPYRFPIPMRGNEHPVTEHALPEVEVSDPHEG